MTTETNKAKRARARLKFEKMAQETTPYRIYMRGRYIPVLPGVFSPKYFTDAFWFPKEVPKLVGKRSLLEIGTGTGVIALFSALGGSVKVVATDINPAAVKNAKATFKTHRVHIDVRLGDIFDPIKPNEKFDVIFWNHPFHYSTVKPKNILLRGGFDYRYQSLRKFFKGAKKHVAPGGEILLGTGAVARVDLIKKMSKENGYSCRLVKKEMVPSKNRPGAFIDTRIYSFVPR
jgi:release factor glutamine methyltransferase